MRTLQLHVPDQMEWTPELLERLSPEFRYEVSQGNLVVMSAAMRPWHADVQARVRNVLVGAGRAAYLEQGVILPEGDIRTCDVGVFRKLPAGNRAYHPASVFELLVEVVSDSSRREDREIKPKLYAAAGVDEYWRVEETTDGEAVVYQYGLVEITSGPATYAELRVITLAALEAAG